MSFGDPKSLLSRVSVRFCLLVILLFGCSCLDAQNFYVVDAGGVVWEVDMSRPCEVRKISGCPINITDIAITPDFKLYAITDDGNLFRKNLSNDQSDCERIGQFQGLQSANALTLAPDGKLYAGGNGLFNYDPLSGEFNFKGVFPLGVLSAGDLCFFRDELFLSGVDGWLYKIDTADATQTTRVLDMHFSTAYGLFAIDIRCSNATSPKSSLFAIWNDGASSHINLVDPDSKEIGRELCILPLFTNGGAGGFTPPIQAAPVTVRTNRTIQPCSGFNNGQILINSDGGIGTIEYSLDNSYFTTSNRFGPLAPGNYIIHVKDAAGCEQTANVLLRESSQPCKDTLYLPTAFTPNGDGLNDVLRVFCGVPVNDFSFEVFNVFGQKVFSSRSIDLGWDGKFNNKELPSGTFSWLIRYNSSFSGQKVFKGLVTLIR
jgi:gliding motility-associated-like protein